MQPPKRSPWGTIESWREIAPGIASVGTPSHGGIKLSRARNAKMPAAVRRRGGWYEEDCEWALVAMVFPEAFPNEELSARMAVRSYFPDEYTAITGAEVKPNESWELRRRRFKAETAGRFVVRSAYGSWHERVPDGFVGVIAVRADDGAKGWWLVPEDKYRSREPGFGYVIPVHEEDDRETVNGMNTSKSANV